MSYWFPGDFQGFCWISWVRPLDFLDPQKDSPVSAHVEDGEPVYFNSRDVETLWTPRTLPWHGCHAAHAGHVWHVCHVYPTATPNVWYTHFCERQEIRNVWYTHLLFLFVFCLYFVCILFIFNFISLYSAFGNSVYSIIKSFAATQIGKTKCNQKLFYRSKSSTNQIGSTQKGFFSNQNGLSN